MSDTPTPPPTPALTAMQMLNAALRKLVYVDGRITGLHTKEGKWVPHAAVELKTVQLMGAGGDQTMTLIFDHESLAKLVEGLITLTEELADELDQAERLRG